MKDILRANAVDCSRHLFNLVHYCKDVCIKKGSQIIYIMYFFFNMTNNIMQSNYGAVRQYRALSAQTLNTRD